MPVVTDQNSLVILLAIAGLLLIGIVASIMVRRKGSSRSAEKGEQIYIKGLNYLLSNETDKAIEEFIRATHLEPDAIEAYLGLGHLYRTKGDFDRAIRLHRSILARPDLKGGDRMQILLGLGADYKSAGLWARAVKVYRQVLEVNPGNAEVYQELAGIHEEERNWQEAFLARQEYDKRTGTRQKSILAHLQTEIGKDHIGAGRTDKAHRAFKSALGLEPACLDAALHLGDLYLEEGKAGKAIEIWEDLALKDAPLSFLAYRRLEKAYFELNRYDDIALLLEKVIKNNPANVMARVALGEYYSKREMIQEALLHLREALNSNPRSLEAREKISRILVQHHLHDEMEKEYLEIIDVLVSPRERYTCSRCGLRVKELVWRCPQCRSWDTFALQD